MRFFWGEKNLNESPVAPSPEPTLSYESSYDHEAMEKCPHAATQLPVDPDLPSHTMIISLNPGSSPSQLTNSGAA